MDNRTFLELNALNDSYCDLGVFNDEVKRGILHSSEHIGYMLVRRGDYNHNVEAIFFRQQKRVNAKNRRAK
jgi:hypothetical protein